MTAKSVLMPMMGVGPMRMRVHTFIVLVRNRPAMDLCRRAS